MSEETITIRFLNHFGGGFAQDIKVEKGTTVESFVKKQLSVRSTGGETDGEGEETLSDSPNDYKIRHNRAPAVSNAVLADGDLIVLVPLKQAGA